MKQLIVYFDGGLGNQMSQYAMYQLLSKRYEDKRVLANIDVYKKNKIHNGFELERIFQNIKLNYASKFQMFMGRYAEKIVQTYESGYPMDQKIFSLEDKSYCFYGTWHNYDYSAIMPVLRKDFEFPELPPECEKTGEEIASCNSVSVHVRKGDYVQYGLDILNLAWYERAVEVIKSKVDNPVFYVFSDEDVRAEFGHMDGDFRFVSGNHGDKAYIDMQLMSMCKHNIIANSTFSYWAAVLNRNPEKIVIRPYMQTKSNKTWTVDGWILLQ